MSKLVTIYGGSGFVGRYIARRMAKDGWRVRVAVRRPNDALFVKPYGVPGQVEPVLCNIRDERSVRAAMLGADAVINCVGILAQSGKNKFGAVHVEGAERVARIAASEAVARLVHISALGADAQGGSTYARTKAAGEAAVLRAYPSATILRPSLIFGPEDNFFNRFASQTVLSPILPIVGGATKFQPVYVDDVAQAAAMAAEGRATAGLYELGGPEVATLRELMGKMLQAVHRRRLVVSLPLCVGSLIGGAFDLAQTATGGLFSNTILTKDQVKSLKSDNLVAAGAKGFADLGIAPTALEAVIPEYLWRYRPSGQYAAIKDSAKNLRKA